MNPTTDPFDDFDDDDFDPDYGFDVYDNGDDYDPSPYDGTYSED